MASYFTSALVAAVCIAVIVAAFVQLLRPLIRTLGQRLQLSGWVRQRKDHQFAVRTPGWLATALGDLGPDKLDERLEMRLDEARGHYRSGFLSLSAFGISSVPTALPDELFMSAVQADAKAALAHPLRNPRLFDILTAELPPETRSALLAMDLIATSQPELALQLAGAAQAHEAASTSSPGDETAPYGVYHAQSHAMREVAPAALAAAEQDAAGAADRCLDDLQRRLLTSSLWFDRGVAVAAGLGLSLVAALRTDVQSLPTILLVGLAGGVMAVLIDDLLSMWRTGTPR